MSSAASRNGSLLYPMLVAMSTALSTLLLQLVQTRIYGVVFWNHLVYFIISIALLGFGISGTWLAFGKDTRLARLLTLRNAALAFVVSAIVSSLIAPQAAISLASALSRTDRLFELLIAYSVAVLPYFFAGWMLGSIFRDWSEDIFALYFIDLVGAGIGCLLFLAAIQPLGAIRLVLLCCLFVAVPPLIFDTDKRTRPMWLLGLLILLLGINFFESAINKSIQPEGTKSFTRLYGELEEGEERIWEFSEWNAISRIDVARGDMSPERARTHPQLAQRIIFIDGDAWTRIVEDESWLDPTTEENRIRVGPRGAFYFFPDGLDAALIIGSGGGPDVTLTLFAGAKSIDAVEINPTTHRLLMNEYREESHDLFYQPGVRSFREEGRSFVRRSKKRYDLISMTGIDTFAALNSGAYVLSENYLYTVEAVKDYVEHLSDRGLLNITRWLHRAETSRLFIVCYEALAQMGYEEPERHIILHGNRRASILVRREPFTDEEIAGFAAYQLREGSNVLFPALPDHEPLPLIAAYVEARQGNEHKAFLANLDIDVSPVTDDSPFFFHFDRPGRHMLAVLDSTRPTDFIRGNWPSLTLYSLLVFTIVASGVFMLLPLVHRGRPRIPGFGLWVLYFSCLGVSFIFIEIALMQRFALLLGHPSRALAYVLASLLIFSGIGSYLRGALGLRIKVCLGALALLVVATAFVYPAIIDLALGWNLGARAALTVGLVAPLGILMGMPFPSGIHRVSQFGAESVPWMWGVNGGTTVVGSILAIIIAINANFSTVLLLGAAGYAMAGLTLVLLDRADSAA